MRRSRTHEESRATKDKRNKTDDLEAIDIASAAIDVPAVWLSHAVQTETVEAPKGAFKLARTFRRHGYRCYSSLLCKTEIGIKGFGEVYKLMNTVGSIVVCCDREYRQEWNRQGSNVKDLTQQSFSHEYHNIISEIGVNGFRRLVVVLLGDAATQDCIPEELRGTHIYKFRTRNTISTVCFTFYRMPSP